MNLSTLALVYAIKISYHNDVLINFESIFHVVSPELCAGGQHRFDQDPGEEKRSDMMTNILTAS